MTLAPRRGGVVIVITFCIALILMVLPLPEWARAFRPQWVTLTLIYWALALPHRVGVGSGFLVGIVLDVLSSAPLLGQHALGLSIVAYATVKLHQRIRLYPLWQQSLVILALLVAEHLIRFWSLGAIGAQPPGLSYWAVPLIGMALWPWMFILLRDLRRRFRVQ
jgi:rod shape-determining protein MreD